SGRMIPALEAEQAVLEYLAQIRLPADWRERVLELSQAKRGDTETYETRKTRLENRLERLKTLYKLGDIEQNEYITERADIHNKLEALKPSQVPEMEEAAAALEQIGSLLKRAKPEELEILFHSMLTTVYLHHDYPGYVVGIEPKPFLKELMDISMLPTWKPPQGVGSASESDDDDPEPDPDGNGRGGNRNEDEGEFVWSGNNGIMTSIDAGEDHWVAVTGSTPVSSAIRVSGLKPSAKGAWNHTFAVSTVWRYHCSSPRENISTSAGSPAAINRTVACKTSGATYCAIARRKSTLPRSVSTKYDAPLRSTLSRKDSVSRIFSA